MTSIAAPYSSIEAGQALLVDDGYQLDASVMFDTCFHLIIFIVAWLRVDSELKLQRQDEW